MRGKCLCYGARVRNVGGRFCGYVKQWGEYAENMRESACAMVPVFGMCGGGFVGTGDNKENRRRICGESGCGMVPAFGRWGGDLVGREDNEENMLRI